MVNRKSATISLFCLLMAAVSLHADPIAQVESTADRLHLRYRSGAMHADTVRNGDTLYSRYSFDGHTHLDTPGVPLLPCTKVSFAVPDDVQPSLNIISRATHDIQPVRIAPVPRLARDDAGFTEARYVEDPRWYAYAGHKIPGHAELEMASNRDDVDIWDLTFYPVLYDATAGQAVIADSLEVIVSFPGAAVRRTSPLPKQVINREVFPRGAESVLKQADAAVNPFASGEWYRVELGGSGFYRINGGSLAEAGFPVGNVASGEIRMYYGGGWMLDTKPGDITTDTFREIAINVNDGGDGIFNAGDAIEFYGEGLTRFYPVTARRPAHQNHLYTDTNVYWITMSDDGASKRIASSGMTPDAALETQTTYPFIKHIEQENHLELVDSGSEWYWDAISNTTKSYTFSAPGQVAGTESEIRIGFINQYVSTSHALNMWVNDMQPIKSTFPNVDKGYKEIRYHSDLMPTGNYVHILRTAGDNKKSIHLDWIEVAYERHLAVPGTSFDFFYNGGSGTPEPVKLRVSNATAENIRVFNITDIHNVSENTSAAHDTSAETVTFQENIAAIPPSRFYIMQGNDFKTPQSITRKSFTNLRNPGITANYFVISHPLFISQANRLVSWRNGDSQTDPLEGMVVNVNDIYDEFSWGVFDPTAIRDFLQYMWENGDETDNYYCCLFGDASFRYKNIPAHQEDSNFVPTFIGNDGLGAGALVTDDFFSIFTISGTPTFSTGRLCVTDAAAAELLVDKIIAYEQESDPGVWRNRVLLVADDEIVPNSNLEPEHTRYTEQLDREIIPPSMERRKILQIEYPMENNRKPAVTEDLLEAVNDGYIIANFFGHGNDDLLAHEHILVGTRDIGRFNNAHRQNLFLIFSCTVANFIQPDNLSLAEILHLREGGGSIGVIAATDETYAVFNLEMSKAFLRNMFNHASNPEYRIGLALQQAKADNGNNNAKRYVLLGDPATRLALPRHSMAVDLPDSLYKLYRYTLDGNVTDGTTPLPYDGTLAVHARGPMVNKTYTAANNTLNINYTQPGKLFFKGESTISGNNFTTSFLLPKDLPSGNSESAIYLYAYGGDTDAAQVVNGFTVGGMHPDAPVDRTGPDFDMSFDGVPFSDGDYISRNPVMRITIEDPSGINIYGNRGHNITLLLDKTESIILTDRFQTHNGYTSGSIEYTLPALSPGEHLIELGAYDSYNNATKKSVQAFVVGSEHGDIAIRNLLNYPNPMTSEGTTFTFGLTDDPKRADIKIYSQAGRLVESFTVSARYGFNEVFWQPRHDIANGVYFYKLSVRSFNGRSSSKIEKLVMMQ